MRSLDGAGRTHGCGRLRRVSGALAVLCVLLAGAVSCTDAEPAGSPGPSVEGDGTLPGPFRVADRVLFPAPSAEGEEEQNAALALLVEMVGHTPPGELIRIMGNSFSFYPVAEALAAAHERGVRVQVITDRGVSGDWKAPALLRETLGTDRRAPSFLHLARGQLHQKSWSFSRTGQSRDVVLVGSMNLTYVSARQFNDVVGFVGRPDVRRVFDDRFVQLRRELPDPAPGPGVDLGRGDRAWFFPTLEDGGDPVRRMLADVPPEGASIRVVMYAWLDPRGLELADLLIAKAAAGADVEVVLGRSTRGVRDLLAASDVVVHDGVLRDADPHNKLTVVSHPDADAPGGRTRFVLTGSDNYTTKSLARPEVLLRLDGDRPAGRQRFADYERFVDRLVARIERSS